MPPGLRKRRTERSPDSIRAPGIVPCPPLCVVIGLGLSSDAFGSRAWGVAAGVLGLFYGTVGVARLDAWIDAPLIFGGVRLALAHVRRRAGGDARRNPRMMRSVQRRTNAFCL